VTFAASTAAAQAAPTTKTIPPKLAISGTRRDSVWGALGRLSVSRRGYSRPVRRTLGILLLAALLAGGCGVRNSKPFTAKNSAGCLKSKGFSGVTTNPRKLDFIAALAENGGIRADSPSGNVVMIAFAAGADSVGSTEQAYTRKAPERYRTHMSDILRISRNAVLVWTVTPKPEELDAAMRCLKA
jgi:hypothetical protein